MLRFVMVMSFGLVASFGVVADWPEFRGPEGKGVYTGKPLPLTWGPDTNVTWKTAIPGLGWSSPIAVKGKLFFTTAVEVMNNGQKDYSLRALCVDAESGSLNWDHEIFVENATAVPQPHKKNSHASPTPVSDGTHVWVHFGHMGTACLDLSGKVIWKTQDLSYSPVHGNGGSPILVDDLVVFCCDGKDEPFVVALDQKTGDVRWKTPRKSGALLAFSFATCQLIEHNGKRVIVSPASNFCMGYDPKDGHELWRVKYPKAGWSLISRPVYAHGLVYVCTGYPSQHLIAFKPEGTGDITANIVWQTARNVANTSTPLIIGDEFYMLADAGFFTCYDAKTGKVHWSERLAGKAYSASPIVSDGKIYVTSEDGVGQVIAAGKEFKEVSKSEMKEKTFATFTPVDGGLFVRTESQIFRFDEKK